MMAGNCGPSREIVQMLVISKRGHYRVSNYRDENWVSKYLNKGSQILLFITLPLKLIFSLK